MTTAQKTAISNKTDGLIVYDSSLSQINVYNAATPNLYSQSVRMCSFQCCGVSNLINCPTENAVTSNYPGTPSFYMAFNSNSQIPIFYNPINNTLSGNTGQTNNCVYLEMNPNVTTTSGSCFTFDNTTGYITLVYGGFYNISSDCRHLATNNAQNTMMIIVKCPSGSSTDYIISRSDGPAYQNSVYYTGEVCQTSTAYVKLNSGDKIRLILYAESQFLPTITISIMGFL
jgi:hypothetical protein